MAQVTFKIDNTTCYCATAGYSISNILQVDSNYMIANSLWSSPKTLPELRESGTRYTQSQLLLLLAFKLIRREGNKFYSNIPFLDSLHTAQLRADAKRRADMMYPYLESDIQALLSELRKKGVAKTSFSILFSYVLDGKIWEALEKKNIMPPRNLSVQNPLWVGEFWSLDSPRKLKCGTNSYDHQNGLELNINWSNASTRKLAYFFNQNGSVKLFKNLNSSYTITDETVRKELEPMQIIDKDGRLTIPVINENSHDTIFQLTQKIVQTISDQLLQLPFTSLMQEMRFNSITQTITISYHEIMWYLLETLVEKQLVKIPDLFIHAADTNMQDISEVLFLIQKEKQQ